jgi:hypothetical protein
MTDFEAGSTSFLDWFQSRPGATFHPSLKLADLRDRKAGRGIIATETIPADEELFVIPRVSLISVQNSELAKKLPKIFSTHENKAPDNSSDHDMDGDQENDRDEIVEPNPWQDLILVLIYEYLQGTTSAWKPYFDVLPCSFDTLMFWTDEELAELQASAVKDKIGKQSANELFQTKVLPVIKEYATIFCASSNLPSDDELMTLAHRMGSLVMSYAFDLETDESKDGDDQEDGWEEDRDGQLNMGMVPMADMLNADAEFNAHLNHGEDNLTMTSLRTIEAGEEVLNYYGALPNSDLLRRYGYTSSKHVRYDVVEIPWKSVLNIIKRNHPGKSLGKLEEEEIEEFFVLERDAGNPTDEGLLSSTPAEFDDFPEELRAQVYQTIAPIFGINTNRKIPKDDEAKLNKDFYNIMAGTLLAVSSQYQTSIEEDEALLQDEKIQGRKRMAIEVRLGEKRLLQEAESAAHGVLRHLAQIEESEKKTQREEGSRPTKRQKR